MDAVFLNAAESKNDKGEIFGASGAEETASGAHGGAGGPDVV